MATETPGATALDPITFEVLRHKLDQIVAEAYHTIGRISGSPLVYEGGDHQEVICTPSGEAADFGAGALHWVRSLSAGVRHVVENYRENPGYDEDDQFLLNDPYIAAVHGMDVQVLAPVIHDGEIIAWAGSASHQTDIGGMDPGSLCVSASEFFQEGFLTPGLKIVEGGVIRRDVEATFRNMVRTPELGVLDIRSKIAANNVIKGRLIEMAERYGAETVQALFEQLISYTERRARAKLERIPDGRWTARNYVEGSRDPYLQVQVAVTKRGDELEFDFTGTSPQSQGPDNMGVNGTMSSAANPFISMLGHDIPWNDGLFKPLKFVLPEGTIVNPRRPAALSANIQAANILVMTSSQNALAKMLLSSEAFRDEACGSICGGFIGFAMAGTDRDGSYFATLNLDCLAGGVGAFADRDGESTAENLWCVKTMIANVETNEMLYPLLYLWRREIQDSGGPGKQRGGLGLGSAVTPWGTDEMTVLSLGCGAEPRSSLGHSGGSPAANTRLSVQRGANVRADFERRRVPASAPELGGSVEQLPAKGATSISAGDVLFGNLASGGGGFGDPIEREPGAVVRDIELGAVSAAMAREVYGVVLGAEGEVDDGASAEERQRIRDRRFELGGGQR